MHVYILAAQQATMQILRYDPRVTLKPKNQLNVIFYTLIDLFIDWSHKNQGEIFKCVAKSRHINVISLPIMSKIPPRNDIFVQFWRSYKIYCNHTLVILVFTRNKEKVKKKILQVKFHFFNIT